MSLSRCPPNQQQAKTKFAEKVVQPQKDMINFTKFAGLLDRIVAALDDYAANPPSP